MDGRTTSGIRCLRVFALLSLLFLTNTAYGASTRSSWVNLQFGVGAGYALGRLGDFANYGPAASAGLRFRPIATIPEMSVVVLGSYRYFPKAGEEIGDFSIVSSSVDMKLTPGFESPSHLYLLGGLGFGRVGLVKAKTTQYLVQDKKSQTGPMAETGAGVEYMSGTRGFFVEFRISNIFSSHFGDYRYAQMTVGAIF